MAKHTKSTARSANGFHHARILINDVCEIAGCPSLVEDARAELRKAGVIEAVQRQDNAPIFDWLMEAVSYQGVSNAAAQSYMEAHGKAAYADIRNSLGASPACQKLKSWWDFDGCGYRKAAFTCSRSSLIRRCPLPRLPLRNGGLNQTAHGLFLFMRDLCDGNFVRWLDEALRASDQSLSPRRGQILVESVVGPLRKVHGISDKTLHMSFSMLLLAGDPNRERWIAAGADAIAIDSLVHAWMSRTGILRRLGSEHLYGPRCYARGGCAEIVRSVARVIDTTRFNPAFPRVFPRFVQHAIWSFCAQSGHAQCNGFNVADGRKCKEKHCELFAICDRVVQPRIESGSVAA